MKRRVLFILLTIISTITLAQSHEIGAFFGGSNFIGDIGRTNYIYPNKFAGGVVYKFNINPRIALRGNYTYIPTSGNDADADNPFRQTQGRSFSNTIHEFAAGAEFNFYDYNISDYRTTYTPYIFTQIALFNYRSPAEMVSSNIIRLESKFSYAIPFGVGIKGLLFDDLAIAFEIGARYTFTDDIDYSTPKINNLNYGGNGNDLYTFTGLSIVYTFGRPQCYSGLTE
ncbi:type IX secretion system protein PorG [Tenacibaculum xiamenense]|uniref:type IX secretion system protein PorG n=1 Tax=Tenacibaculum xiamenense TaxID=1261553 RepID=UPI0038936C19